MNLPQEIIVVSGLPRSGTSLMMQMLSQGGVEIVTDHLRSPDPDNPRGYFEYEAAKDIEDDASWLPTARGKAVKMISMLLYHLPPTERYRVLFLERDLEEVLQSQETMLRRMNRPSAAPSAEMLSAYQTHLERLHEWLAGRTEISLLRVGYRNLLNEPATEARRIAHFLGRNLDLAAMTTAIDPALYRNRKP
ncbi:sulfotransferase domain-containing protein [Schlesneria sp. T3-172]|uniref:sulfotransferase domain-containing protein n=1 Tax=Schlesneria sphaerica TaxID=3373610 RepID=UPI0037C5FAC2